MTREFTEARHEASADPVREPVLALGARDVRELLDGREADVVEAVRSAYLAHRAGESCLPHSTFVRFPKDPVNRVIALPGYLGGEFDVPGMKWIASFPGNVARGVPRASAVMVLSSRTTGRPTVLMEGSIVSARRTAASAALAGRELTGGEPPERAGLIGTGLINFETARFLRQTLPSIRSFTLFDMVPENARRFGERLEEELGAGYEVADQPEEVFESCRLAALATTAVEPHLDDLSMCPEGATILHTSLRDITPEVILAADNVVDDVDHVLRASTSVHLAEQRSGSRDFVRCTLADVLAGDAAPRRDAAGTTIFSPFGLGVLDLAVGKLVLDLARRQGRGSVLESFLPDA